MTQPPPYGQPPYGQPPYGQQPYGQPFGGQPYGQGYPGQPGYPAPYGAYAAARLPTTTWARPWAAARKAR